MKHRLTTGVVAAAGMLLLILDTRTALTGAAAAIDLCAKTVIPALFPFVVLSMLLTDSISGTQSRLLRPVGKLCRMSPGSEILLIIGLLGGYPTGAQAVAQAQQNGQISRQEARRLLGFCSNAGPSFLFGIAAGQFNLPGVGWLLWGLHILSAILTGMLLPGGGTEAVQLSKKEPMTLPQALRRSIQILSSVCGWVILFRILLAFVQRWFLWMLPTDVATTICAALELANGCCSLGTIQNESLRFVICSAALAFGGLCVVMQTVSTVGVLGLGAYLPGKILQTAVSIVLSSLLYPLIYGGGQGHIAVLWIPAAIICAAFFAGKRKKCVAIPG